MEIRPITQGEKVTNQRHVRLGNQNPFSFSEKPIGLARSHASSKHYTRFYLPGELERMAFRCVYSGHNRA